MFKKSLEVTVVQRGKVPYTFPFLATYLKKRGGGVWDPPPLADDDTIKAIFTAPLNNVLNLNIKLIHPLLQAKTNVQFVHIQ